MKKRYWMAGTVLGLLLASTSASPEDRSPSSSPLYVSLVDLMVRPELVREGMIRVGGFLSATSGLNLFLTEGHAEIRDIAASVSVHSDPLVELQTAGCLSRYVMLVGSFGKRKNGTYAIKRLEEVWIPAAEWGENLCWKRN